MTTTAVANDFKVCQSFLGAKIHDPKDPGADLSAMLYGVNMGNFLQRIAIEPFERFFDKVIKFLPNLLTAILILILGVVLGVILKGIFLRLFKAIGLDRVSERSGVIELLRKGGIKDSVSVLLAKVVGWITVVVFAIISMRELEIPTVERLFESFLIYLPNVFVAALILLFGYLLGNFFGRAALIASVNAGIRFSGIIGKSVKFTVFILAATMALEQLGIGRGTIIIAFAIIFGGIVLALSIAFGLGGRDIAKEYLEKKVKGAEKDEIEHI
jgi:small-conductance mechanosensitive channel